MAATAVLAPTASPVVECDERGCREAYSHRDTCECSCMGEGHGVRYRRDANAGAAQFQARAARVGGVFATIPAASDDELW